MSTLKEKAQVIMLPTENECKIIKIDNNLNLYEFDVKQINGRGYTAQHLYIVSDEEIKEGDWCIITESGYNNTLYQPKTPDDVNSVTCIDSKKIIATTNKSLTIKTYDYDRPQKYNPIKETWSGKPKYKKIHLPQPSQGFIEKYIKEYNKGNIIIEVNVEYKQYFSKQGYNRQGDIEHKQWVKKESIGGMYDFNLTKEVLKISKNNTISILPIKTSYTYDDITHALAYGYKGRMQGLAHHDVLLNYKKDILNK